MRCSLKARHTDPTSERWRERCVCDSDDAAVLAGFSSKFPLPAQPEGEAAQNQNDDGEIERTADGDQHGLESPFDELGHGGNELLEVHGCDLLPRK